jgi:Tfp pilus assembly protein PilW
VTWRSSESSPGFSLVELLVALGLGLAIAIAAVATVATGLRALARLALRAEAEDVLSLGLEAFTLDVRRAGFDPRATGLPAVVEASASRLALQADLDGDGLVDATSEESTAIACDVPGGRLSRIVGSQSLPLANGVVACTLEYADASGIVIPVPGGGLDAGARARVRRATLAVALRPPGSGSAAAASRRATVALRSTP